MDSPFVDLMADLAAGFVMTAIVRLAVPRVRTITWPTSALLAALAASASFGVASLVAEDPTWLGLAGAFALTVVFLLVATSVEGRVRPFAPAHGMSTPELLRLGESASVEFKATARRNQHTGERDPAIENVIAKTVCGFLNARGGTLLVGVDDDGEPIGLEPDLPLMKFPDHDGYELFLTDLLSRSLGVPAASSVRVRFEAPDSEAEVCRIDVPSSPVPVYLTPATGKKGRTSDPEFWVRSGNGTRQLRIDELLDYHRGRWGPWWARRVID